MAGNSPEIEWEPLEVSTIRADLGLLPDEVFVREDAPEQRKPIARKRGRLSRTAGDVAERATDTFVSPIPPAALNKRDEREVQKRLQNILTGTTGIFSNAKDYLQMTEEEAAAISEPLASYLVRNADTIPVARQVLENYDLAAIGIGTGAYLVRVYHDRTDEVAQSSPTQPTILDRLRPSNGHYQEESEIRDDGEVAITNGQGLRGGTGLRHNVRAGNL